MNWGKAMLEIQLDTNNEQPVIKVPADGVIRLVMNPETPISTALDAVSGDLLRAVQVQLYALFANRSVIRDYVLESGNPHSTLVIRFASPQKAETAERSVNSDPLAHPGPAESPVARHLNLRIAEEAQQSTASSPE